MSQAQTTDTTPDSTGPAPTTIVAGVVVLIFGGIFALTAAGLTVYVVIAMVNGRSTDTFAGSIGELFLPFFVFILLLVLVFGIGIVGMGWMVMKRRNGARWSAIVLFALFTLSALGSSTSGKATSPAGQIGGAIFLGLVPVMLLLPATSADFRAARDRRRATRFAPPPPPMPPPPPFPPPAAPSPPPA